MRAQLKVVAEDFRRTGGRGKGDQASAGRVHGVGHQLHRRALSGARRAETCRQQSLGQDEGGGQRTLPGVHRTVVDSSDAGERCPAHRRDHARAGSGQDPAQHGRARPAARTPRSGQITVVSRGGTTSAAARPAPGGGHRPCRARPGSWRGPVSGLPRVAARKREGGMARAHRRLGRPDRRKRHSGHRPNSAAGTMRPPVHERTGNTAPRQAGMPGTAGRARGARRAATRRGRPDAGPTRRDGARGPAQRGAGTAAGCGARPGQAVQRAAGRPVRARRGPGIRSDARGTGRRRRWPPDLTRATRRKREDSVARARRRLGRPDRRGAVGGTADCQRAAGGQTRTARGAGGATTAGRRGPVGVTSVTSRTGRGRGTA